MAIDFPTPATLGLTYAYSGVTWTFNGVGWQPTVGSGGGGAGITRTVTTLTVNGTAGATGDYVYFLNGANLALPTAVGNSSMYVIKNIGGSSQTVTPAGAETIDGSAGGKTMASLDALTLFSTGTNWEIV